MLIKYSTVLSEEYVLLCFKSRVLWMCQIQLQDMESTEHDGDVEDYTEGEGESTEPEQGDRVMYYPPAEETGRLDTGMYWTVEL